jgi:hypothetical protein
VRAGRRLAAELQELRCVVGRDRAVVRALRRVAEQALDHRHGLDARDAFDGEIRLVGEGAGEVVGRDLVLRDERVLNQELRPLIEELGLFITGSGTGRQEEDHSSYVGLDERVVSGLLGVAERHDEHVAAFCLRVSHVC